MSSLRDKTISGVFWSFLQKIGGSGFSIIITLFLARLLTPKDYGLIGMLVIFIELSTVLMQAGFNEALIQKKHADEEDYSSVFYLNLVFGLIIYGILFFVAPLIGKFYEQPILSELTRILGLIFIINAFSYVQETKLRKEMRFKVLTVIHLPSVIISGGVAIIMAYSGFGVWSLVAQRLVARLIYTIQIWIYAKWKPLWSFNTQKAKGLFAFGGNLMLSGITGTFARNIYLVLIGKFFPVSVLGYYNYAKKLVDLPSRTLAQTLRAVTFPAFSSIQDDDVRLKRGYKKVLQQVLFWLCPILVLSAVLANPLFTFVLTEKWLPVVPYFRILCVTGLFYPLNAYNLEIVNVKGRSDIFLKLAILRNFLVIAGAFVAIPFGVWTLVSSQAVIVIINYFINSYFAGKFINYHVGEQLLDILPIFILTLGIGTCIFFLDYWLFFSLPNWSRIIIGYGIGMGLYWLISNLIYLSPYQEALEIVKAKVSRLLPKKLF